MNLSLTEAIDLLRAERKAWHIVVGHGPLNAKYARYFEVRVVALELLCCRLFEIKSAAHEPPPFGEREQPKSVTCYHCWEVFDLTSFHGSREARRHFGQTPAALPGCVIISYKDRSLLQTLRDTEESFSVLRLEKAELAAVVKEVAAYQVAADIQDDGFLDEDEWPVPLGVLRRARAAYEKLKEKA